MKRMITSAAVCLAACLSGTAALAQPDQETVVTGAAQPAPALGHGRDRITATVRFGDLDLASAAGAAVLHGRVYRAATRLCIRPDLQPVSSVQAGFACRDNAIAGARDQIAAAIEGRGNAGRLAAASLVITAAR